MDRDIIIENLSYSYELGDRLFKLGPINTIIQHNKLTILKGHNGSGKSTFAKILAGDITIAVPDVTFKNLPQKISYYNQSINSNIFDELTVAEHLQLLSKTSIYNLEELYSFFPVLFKLYNKYPDELSGGEKQLLGFTTLICKNSDLFIFDEVFNHLDTSTSKQILHIINSELIDKKKSTVVVISHNLEIFKFMKHNIIEFASGKITLYLYGQY